MTPVSIFNDVIGPVMREPSSSHRAAALRIGRLARDQAIAAASLPIERRLAALKPKTGNPCSCL